MANKYHLIWISTKIEEEEYNEYIDKEIKPINKFEIDPFKTIKEGIDKIKKIFFEECIIIIDSNMLNDFNTQFNKIIDDLCLIPKIIIFINGMNIEKVNKYISDNSDKICFINNNLIFTDFESLKKELIINDAIKYFSNNDKFIFEQIKNKDDLGLLINYHKLLSEPSNEDIRKFNHFLYDTFKDIDINLSYLLNQTFKQSVPKRIILRYWLRIFSFMKVSEEINNDLKKRNGNKFDVYIKFLYHGLSKEYIKPILNQSFYRGGILSIDELNEIKNNLKNKKTDIPSCICFSKVFLNFSLDEKIGKQLMEESRNKIVMEKEKLVFFEITKGNDIDLNNATNVELQKLSLFPERNEVLFFPYSCFEVSSIEDINGNSNKTVKFNFPYTHIKLQYLGKYKELVPKEIKNCKNLSSSKFVKTLFKSRICSKEEMKTVIDNNTNIFTPEEKYEILSSIIIGVYSVNKDILNKNLVILDYNKDKNENEIKNNYIGYNVDSKNNESSINKLFTYNFKQLGEINITFIFKNEIKNLSKLFNMCSNLIDINLSNFKMENVTDTSFMFNKCEMLEKINLSNLNTQVTITTNMFFECKKLKNINLNNFTKQTVKECQYMFYGCESLKEIDFKNFKIEDNESNFNMFPPALKFNYIGVDKNSILEKKIKYSSEILGNNIIIGVYSVNKDILNKNLVILDYNKDKNENEIKNNYIGYNVDSKNNESSINKLFTYNFKQLGEINITFIFKNEIKNLSKLFNMCSNLIDINLSNFKMENVTDTSFMFNKCEMLEKINLSNLNTQVTITTNMFFECKKLKNINLNNFTKQTVKECQYMFYGCESLKEIDFKNFKIEDNESNFNMFPPALKFNYIGVDKNSILEKKILDSR